MKKRALAFLLIFTMLFSMLPATAVAVDEGPDTGDTEQVENTEKDTPKDESQPEEGKKDDTSESPKDGEKKDDSDESEPEEKETEDGKDEEEGSLTDEEKYAKAKAAFEELAAFAAELDESDEEPTEADTAKLKSLLEVALAAFEDLSDEEQDKFIEENGENYQLAQSVQQQFDPASQPALIAETDVAEIGGTGYATLAAALAAAKSGDTVTILKDGSYTLPATMDGITVKANAGVTATVDYSACTGSYGQFNNVSFEGITFLLPTGDYTGFQHSENLSFKSCTLNGKLFSYGTMVFDTCTFNAPAGDYAMWCYAGNLTYTNCIFNGSGKFLHVYNEGNTSVPWNIKVDGCTFNNSGNAGKAALNVKETCGTTGLAYNVAVSNCTTTGAFPAASSSDKLVVYSPLVQVDTRNAAVASQIKVNVDGALVYTTVVAEVNGVGYATLDAALAAAKSGDTVKLLADVNQAKTLTIPAGLQVTLDLAGKTLSMTSAVAASDALIDNNGDLTIDDTVGNGKLTYCSSVPSTAYAYATNTIKNEGTVTVQAGTLVNTTKGGASYVVDNNSTVANVSLTVNGGTLDGTSNVAVRQFANSTTKTNDVIVNNGVLTGKRAVWTQLPGSSGQAKQATVTVNGGTLTATGEVSGGYNYQLGIYVSTGGDVFDNIKVTVNGGTIDGDVALGNKTSVNAPVVSITGGTVKDAYTYASDDSYVSITGGTFYEDVTPYCAEDYIAVAQGTSPETWKVEKAPNVAEVNGTGYTTLEKALAAATSGDTIKLLADVNQAKTLTIPATLQVTLDLAGKTLSMASAVAASDALINNKGDLTIDDTVGNGKLSYNSSTPDPGYGYATNTITNQGIVTVQAGTLENTTKGGASYVVDNNSTVANVSLTVNGGTLDGTAANNAIRQFINSSVQTNDVEINSGIVTGRRAVWMQLPNSKAEPRPASLTVNGGTLTAAGEASGNKWAVLSESSGNDRDGVTITINGGSLTGDVAVGEGKGANGEMVRISGGTMDNVYAYNTGAEDIILTGGTYKADVSAYCAKGYVCRSMGGGLYTVTALGPEAEINGKTYSTLADAFNAAVAGDTVKLLTYVELSADTETKCDVTLDTNGFTLIGTKKLKVADGTTLTVKGTVDSDIYIYDSVADYNGAQTGYTANLDDGSYKFYAAYVNGGSTLNVGKGATAAATYWNVYGGELNIAGVGNFSGTSGGTIFNVTGKVNVTGTTGASILTVFAAYAGKNAGLVEVSGTANVANSIHVGADARTDARYYGTNDDGSRTVPTLNVTGTLNITGGDGSTYTSSIKNQGVLNIADGASLTVGAPNMFRSLTLEIDAGSALKVGNANVTFCAPDSTYWTADKLVNKGTIELKPGSSYSFEVYDLDNQGTITVDLSNAKVGDVIIDYTGSGTPNYGTYTSTGNGALALGVSADNKLVVIDAVAEINGNGYATLEAALDAAKSGDTIKLLADVNQAKTLTIPTGLQITLDLAGKTLSMTSAVAASDALINNKGDLTIDDTVGGGKLTYYSSVPSASAAYATNTINNEGTVTVQAGTLVNTTKGGASYVVDNNSTVANVSLTVNGGTLDGTNNIAVRQYANSETNTNDVVLSGGAVTGKRGVTIQEPTKGKNAVAGLTVNGGTLTSTGESGGYQFAVYSYSSGGNYDCVSVTVTGGTIDGDIGVGGGSANGGAGAEKVRISGGTITDVYTYNKNAEDISITGGTFYTDVSDCCASGYAAGVQGTSPETWKVQTSKVTNDTTGEEYASLSEALAAASAGDTLTLKDDITDGAGLIIDKSVTIDLNGNTYTVTKDPAGSAYTKTQAVQILPEAGAVTIKNGTLAANNSAITMIIQNYADTTLEDVTVKGGNVSYGMSNNSGNVNITGSTSIEGVMDVSYWPSNNPNGCTVTVNTTGKIDEIELGFYGDNGNIAMPVKTVLNLTDGLVDELSISVPTSGSYAVNNATEAELLAAAQISKGGADVGSIPNGYEWVNNKLTPMMTVTFDENGSRRTETVAMGSPIAEPTTTPTKSGSHFTGWEVNGKAYNFSDPVNAPITITAGFEQHNTKGSVNHVDATCTTDGVQGGTYCTVCEEGSTEALKVLKATGHSYTGTVAAVAATCTTDGVVGGTYCVNCDDGKAAAEQTIPATGHSYTGSVAHVEPTCTNAGVQGGTYCTVCNDGKANAEAPIPATGHNWGAWVVTRAATYNATGSQQRVCQNDAGHVETQTIPRLTYNWPVVNPTPTPTPEPTPTATPEDEEIGLPGDNEEIGPGDDEVVGENDETGENGNGSENGNQTDDRELEEIVENETPLAGGREKSHSLWWLWVLLGLGALGGLGWWFFIILKREDDDEDEKGAAPKGRKRK